MATTVEPDERVVDDPYEQVLDADFEVIRIQEAVEKKEDAIALAKDEYTATAGDKSIPRQRQDLTTKVSK